MADTVGEGAGALASDLNEPAVSGNLVKKRQKASWLR
jgi:hypothetical protein